VITCIRDVVELVGRSAPIGVSQLNTMPLDLRIIQNCFSDLRFVFIYFIIQNTLIKIDIQSSASAVLITIRDTIIISNTQISLVPETNLKLTITLHDFDHQLK